MSSSLSTFKTGLYREHLEEASFLYEQRCALLQDPEIGWSRLRDFEARLEAHIDGLLVGGDPALEVCRSRIADGDTGELFAVVCVICRQQRATLLNEVWRELDFNDSGKVRAVTDALKLEMPVSWGSFCERAIARGAKEVLPILAEVCAYRRMPMGDLIARALLSMPEHRHARAMWALSRLAVSEVTLEALQRGLHNPRADVRSASVLGLLWTTRPIAIQVCQQWAGIESWPQLYLALGGLRSTVDLLRRDVEAGRATPITFQALGLLGDLSAVHLLRAHLDNQECAAAAAQALHWITGAPLYEEVFVEEEIHEDELFDAEKRLLRETGQKPARDDGTPFGNSVRRLSRNADAWERWLEENASQFDGQVRYRLGRPHSPRSVLRGLMEDSAPLELRRWSYEELSIRYSCPVAFEADWRVHDQMEALREMSVWATANETFLGAGEWR
jgi:uncharacterized protein (TIGR02270 family)